MRLRARIVGGDPRYLWAGIVLASDPNGRALTSDFRGGVDVETLQLVLTGSVYLPNERPLLSGNGTTTLHGNPDKLVTRSLAVTGNHHLALAADETLQSISTSSLRLTR